MHYRRIIFNILSFRWNVKSIFYMYYQIIIHLWTPDVPILHWYKQVFFFVVVVLLLCFIGVFICVSIFFLLKLNIKGLSRSEKNKIIRWSNIKENLTNERLTSYITMMLTYIKTTSIFLNINGMTFWYVYSLIFLNAYIHTQRPKGLHVHYVRLLYVTMPLNVAPTQNCRNVAVICRITAKCRIYPELSQRCRYMSQRR